MKGDEKMLLSIVVVSALMLVGSVWFYTRNEDREQARMSVVGQAAIDSSERMEEKFEKGLAEIKAIAERLDAIEAKPAPTPTNNIPSRITVEIVERVRPSVDNSAGKASLDLMRESSRAQQAVKSLKKVRSQGSGATQ